MTKSKIQVPADRIADAILLLRGHRVMLDSTLAELYGVRTRNLVQALKRNINRFPADFCFQLGSEEVRILRSQTVISSGSWGGRRQPPYAFTEQGVAMLSSVLRSPGAIAVNIEIMRTFVLLRRTLAGNKMLAEQFEALERRIEGRLTVQDEAIREILEAIRSLMKPPDPSGRPIGFVTGQGSST